MNHPQELQGLEDFLGKQSRSALKIKSISFYKASTEWEDDPSKEEDLVQPLSSSIKIIKQ